MAEAVSGAGEGGRVRLRHDPVASTLRKLFAQPRIPGVRRLPRHTSLLPSVETRLRDRALREGRSVSAIAAQILSAHLGVDAFTGDTVARRVVRLGKKGK
jgi:plasmid stability protein